MIEWLIPVGAVAALLLFSGKKEEKDTVAVPRGNLPLSGKPRSQCPNVQLPIFEGTGKGELIDVPEQLRAVYGEPLKIDPSTFVGDSEMAKSIRETNADALDNLAMQAECAGYLGLAQKLYDHAKKIRSASGGPTAASNTNNEKSAIADTATTAESLADDFAELPEALREYVGAFVMDPSTLPQVFIDGANMLVGGDPENVSRVGLDMGGIPIELPSTPDEIFPVEVPSDFSEFTEEEMKSWYFPRAAARLRRIAIERAEAMGLPDPFAALPKFDLPKR